MTPEVKKSLLAAAGVLVCISAIAGGALLRDRVDYGGALAVSPEPRGTLVASNDNNVVPEDKFFEDMMELLKRKYVDGISDDQKLSDGAVRGMIASLGDPNSLYMDADQLRVYMAAHAGRYEGIGADVVLYSESSGKVQSSTSGAEEDATPTGDEKLPKLMIAAIVPGSAADKAGLKPGDWVEFVEDHWLPNSDALDQLRDLQKKVVAGKVPGGEFLKLRKVLRTRFEKSMLPIRGRDRLMMGTDGSINATFVRGAQRIPLTLAKGKWTMRGFGVKDGVIRLPFVKDSADQLKEAIAGKADVTIDLRGNVDGDFDAMLACLKAVAPSGNYGYLVTRKQEKASALALSDGNAAPPKVTLLVDRTTRGSAEIFALALSSKGVAKLSGTEMAGQRYVLRYNLLPSRAGYSLVTAEYRVSDPGIVARAKAEARK